MAKNFPPTSCSDFLGHFFQRGGGGPGFWEVLILKLEAERDKNNLENWNLSKFKSVWIFEAKPTWKESIKALSWRTASETYTPASIKASLLKDSVHQNLKKYISYVIYVEIIENRDPVLLRKSILREVNFDKQLIDMISLLKSIIQHHH